MLSRLSSIFRLRKDADVAVVWYAERSARAAERFLEELETAVTAIQKDPTRLPEFDGGARRFRFRRFPDTVIYRVLAGSIEILAVAHGRRRPGYWRGRVPIK